MDWFLDIMAWKFIIGTFAAENERRCLIIWSLKKIWRIFEMTQFRQSTKILWHWMFKRWYVKRKQWMFVNKSYDISKIEPLIFSFWDYGDPGLKKWNFDIYVQFLSFDHRNVDILYSTWNRLFFNIVAWKFISWSGKWTLMFNNMVTKKNLASL